ncbi:MAG: ArsC/Spx/MgsR family protein, partial [Burkholderiaceae bacterium]
AFTLMTTHMGRLGAMARGDVPFDAAAAQASARVVEVVSHLPWDALLNRRGLTWRQLPEIERNRVVDATSAAELMLAHPVLIKRPVLELDDRILVGFSEALYAGVFDKNNADGRTT